MRLISKQPETSKNYWIQDYTDSERDFLLSIGFKENKYPIKSLNNLTYYGSDMVQGWSETEKQTINQKIVAQYGNLEIEHQDPYE